MMRRTTTAVLAAAMFVSWQPGVVIADEGTGGAPLEKIVTVARRRSQAEAVEVLCGPQGLSLQRPPSVANRVNLTSIAGPWTAGLVHFAWKTTGLANSGRCPLMSL